MEVPVLFSGVIVTLSGCLVWIVKRLLETTLPSQQSAFLQQLEDSRKMFHDSLIAQLTTFEAELQRGREFQLQVHKELVDEVRSLTDGVQQILFRIEKLEGKGDKQ
jgi:hypothetical protein